MTKFKTSTNTYIESLRNIYPHFKKWKDSEIIDLCLIKKIEEAKDMEDMG